MESVKGADVAVTHKLLHHAWPRLLPLIDSLTIGKLGRKQAWVTLLEDLRRHEFEFSELEEWFRIVVGGRGGVELTRLRLYDILLWCRVAGDEQEAQQVGSTLVTP